MKKPRAGCPVNPGWRVAARAATIAPSASCLEHNMRALAALFAALSLACNRSPRTDLGDREVIRASEIATMTGRNAYDIVAKLRPEFLKARGPVSAARGRATELPASTVFVDGVESHMTSVGDVDVAFA